MLFRCLGMLPLCIVVRVRTDGSLISECPGKECILCLAVTMQEVIFSSSLIRTRHDTSLQQGQPLCVAVCALVFHFFF